MKLSTAINGREKREAFKRAKAISMRYHNAQANEACKQNLTKTLKMSYTHRQWTTKDQ